VSTVGEVRKAIEIACWILLIRIRVMAMNEAYDGLKKGESQIDTNLVVVEMTSS